MLSPIFNFNEIEPQIRRALHLRLGDEILVSTEEVDSGRVFVKVVSPIFNGHTERQKQEMVWSALQSLGPESQAVSLVLAFGMDEI